MKRQQAGESLAGRIFAWRLHIVTPNRKLLHKCRQLVNARVTRHKRIRFEYQTHEA
jgi:hypothetical protein